MVYGGNQEGCDEIKKKKELDLMVLVLWTAIMSDSQYKSL